MTALATTSTIKIGTKVYTKSDLDLTWRAAAKDCNSDEFSQFMHVAGHLGLDPLRKQIYAFVFGKDDPEKRRMAIVVGIDGFRSVAARSGDYRPDERPARFTYDDAAKNPETNPSGIVSAEVTVFRFAHGSWFPISVEAYWEEFAPIIDEVKWTEDSDGKRRPKPTGKRALDPRKDNWHKMPRIMLAKCAEAQCLRRGWPESLSAVYEQSELDQSEVVDLTPAEWAEAGAVEKRLEKIAGASSILFDMLDDQGLQPIPIGKAADRIFRFIEENKSDPGSIEYWAERNKHPLQEFWARAKSDALAVKKKIEELTKAQAA